MDAASLRSYQRQKFLEEVHTSIIRLEDDHDRRELEDALIRTCLDYLKGEIPKELTSPAEKFFFEVFLPNLQEFSRAEEESKALVAELLEWLVQSTIAEFRNDLTSLEGREPQRILHASSWSVEVPLTED